MSYFLMISGFITPSKRKEFEQKSMGAFCKSQEFRLIAGVFQALGSQDQDILGKEINMRSFELLINTQTKI